MPDTIRITVEGLGAHPPKARLRASSTRYSGFRAAGTAIAAALGLGHPLALTPAGAEDTLVRDASSVDAYIAAFLLLDRHETRRARAHARRFCASRSSPRSCWCARARASPTPRPPRATRASPARAAVDRAYALLLSEPQILVAWAAGADEPEIIGDPAWSPAPMRRTACSPSAPGSSPTRRRDMERAVDALRARGDSFAMTLTTLAGRIVEAEGQVIGGRAILRLRGRERHQARARRADRAPPEADRRHRRACAR